MMDVTTRWELIWQTMQNILFMPSTAISQLDLNLQITHYTSTDTMIKGCIQSVQVLQSTHTHTHTHTHTRVNPHTKIPARVPRIHYIQSSENRGNERQTNTCSYTQICKTNANLCTQSYKFYKNTPKDLCKVIKEEKINWIYINKPYI